MKTDCGTGSRASAPSRSIEEGLRSGPHHRLRRRGILLLLVAGLGMVPLLVLPGCGDNACQRYMAERCNCCETFGGRQRCLDKVEAEYLATYPRYPSTSMLSQCEERKGKFDCEKEGAPNIYAYCGEESGAGD